MVISSQEYSRRRQALLATMQPGSAALILLRPKSRAAPTANIPIARAAISGTSPALTSRKRCWC